MLRYEVKSHRSLDRMSDEELLLELLDFLFNLCYNYINWRNYHEKEIAFYYII